MHEFPPFSGYNSGLIYQNLIQKVLNELFLEWPHLKQSMEIGSQKLGHKIATDGYPLSFVREHCHDRSHLHVLKRRNKDIAQTNNLEQYTASVSFVPKRVYTHVFMSQSFQQLQFAIGSFR